MSAGVDGSSSANGARVRRIDVTGHFGGSILVVKGDALGPGAGLYWHWNTQRVYAVDGGGGHIICWKTMTRRRPVNKVGERRERMWKAEREQHNL